MNNFKLISQEIVTEGLLAQLKAHPELWDEHPERRMGDSPHVEMSDIWVRFRPKHELVYPQSWVEPHIPAWYPSRRLLTEAERISLDMMAAVRGVQLGGILITKIPPGCGIKPHHDRGRWHSEFFNTKVYVPIQSNPGCLNICGEDSVSMQEGSAWHFDNLKVHSVENNGNMDRITLIISMRTEP